MAYIIRKKINNAIYVIERTSYRENGKVKTKDKMLGKLDENGNFIPSKKNSPEVAGEPKEPQNQEEVKAFAVLDKSTEPQEQKPEVVVVEAEVVTDFISTKVDKYTSGTTKTEITAFDHQKNEDLYTNGGAINVSRNEVKRKEINVIVSLDFKELKTTGGITIDMEYRLTPFDRAVHNAVASLWEAGHRNGMKNNEYLTPKIIFQLLAGNTGESKYISPRMRKAIVRSIDKMRHTEITIDNSNEVKELHCDQVKYIGSLVESRRLEITENKKITINGNEVEDCIQILQCPILYKYAQLKKQVCNIDIKMFNIPRYVPIDEDDDKKKKTKKPILFRNTPANIELKEYLLQRIMAMKNQKSRMSETIRYETIYDYLRIEAPTKGTLLVKYMEVRKKVKFLLNYWKRERFIKGYREEKEGRLIAKVTITC